MKPLIYGYLRTDLIKHPGQFEICDRTIREFASAHSFDLGTVFQEPPDQMWSALAALMIELKRSDCHHVVVPALAHIRRPGSAFPNALVELLHAHSRAVVWVAEQVPGHPEISATEQMLLGHGG